MSTSTVARTTYREVFTTPGFAALFTTTTLTVLGISLQILAFSVVVFETTGSSTWSSAAFAAGFLPGVVGGLLLPSLADRWPARPLIAVGSLVRLGLGLLLAVLASSSSVPAGIAVVALGALLHPLVSAAQSGLLLRLLEGDRYVLGRSLFTMTSMLAQLAGLAVGGLVLQALGAGAVLVLAAAMHGVALLISWLGLPSVPAPGSRSPWTPGETLRGYRDLFGHSLVRPLLLLWWTPFALLAGVESLAVSYAGQTQAGGAATAVLMGATPLGALVGTTVVGRLCRPATRERLVPVLLALLGVSLLPLALTPSAPVAAVLMALAGVGLAFETGGQAAFRNALPPGRQALGFGLLGVGLMTGQGLGPLVAGPLADLSSPGTASAVLGLLILLTTPVLLRGAGVSPALPPTATTPALLPPPAPSVPEVR
ncbi:MFS transporter [Kineosporia succinea]|uniref:MFS family permease n=1 Tax=Kineosporia succinea TaxID=84632 RepID=A0ABT9P650_9ACTN|nr:MFS transporter [Kineosporia succinea]MDP9827909.1 MFS family permease [Kineosporia succinea]